MKKFLIVLLSLFAISCSKTDLINSSRLVNSYTELTANYETVLDSVLTVCTQIEEKQCDEMMVYLAVVNDVKHSLSGLKEPYSAVEVVDSIAKLQTEYKKAKIAWVNIRRILVESGEIDPSKKLLLSYYDESGKNFDRALQALFKDAKEKEEYLEIVKAIFNLLGVAVKTASLV